MRLSVIIDVSAWERLSKPRFRTSPSRAVQMSGGRETLILVTPACDFGGGVFFMSNNNRAICNTLTHLKKQKLRQFLQKRSSWAVQRLA
jgi:hypothetical protein